MGNTEKDIFVPTIVEARDLVKLIGEKKVVDGVSFNVEKGECYGIFGPPGSGKTSLLRMLACLSPFNVGDIYIKGLNLKNDQGQIKNLVGYVPSEDSFEPEYSVLENLILFARYYGISKRLAKKTARQLLRLARLEAFEASSLTELNQGQKRRLAIIRSLMCSPEVIFVDEPIKNLSRNELFWVIDLIVNIKKQGVSIILASEVLSELDQIIDQTLFLNHGRVECQGVPIDLVKKIIGYSILEFKVSNSDMMYYRKKVEQDYDYQVVDNKIKLMLQEHQDRQKALKMISSDNIIIRKANLDDVYLKISGEPIQ